MSTTKTRRACFEAHKWTHPVTGRIMLTCHLCGEDIEPALGTTKGSPHEWEAEHVKRRALGGADTPDNVKPAHKSCHKPKTKVDNRENAKGTRVRDKHYGIERTKHPMPGSRNHPSRLRKRMNGTVERW